MARRDFRAVDQKLDVLGELGGDVKAHAGSRLGAGELEKAFDRSVESGRFLRDDVEQLFLRRLLGKCAREHLHRARDRRQRIADLVRQAGGHLAHRGHAVLEPELLLHLTPFGQVLEDDQIAGPGAVGPGELIDGVADALGLVADGVVALFADSLVGVSSRHQLFPDPGIEEAELGQRALGEPLLALTEDLLAGAVGGGDAPLAIGGDDAAGDRAHHVAVGDAQIGEVGSFLLQLGFGLGNRPRQTRGEKSDGVEAGEVDPGRIDRLSQHRGLHLAGGELEIEDGDIGEPRQRRDGDAGAAPQEHRRHRDDDEIEDRQRVAKGAVVPDQGGDQGQVAEKLQVGLPAQVRPAPQQQDRVDQAAGIGGGGPPAEKLAIG